MSESDLSLQFQTMTSCSVCKHAKWDHKAQSWWCLHPGRDRRLDLGKNIVYLKDYICGGFEVVGN